MDPLAIVLAQTDAADSQGEQSPSGAQQMAQWVLLAAGMVIIIWVLLRLQWKRQRRTFDQSPVAEMRQTLIDRQAEGERAAEVAEMVRDLAARLETRAARLEALIDQADERIEKLEARVAANGLSENMSAARPATPQASNGQPTDPWDDQPQPAAPARGDASDPLHQEVYDLADNGHTPLAIARRLDQQVGTIELILALRR
ncbi:MAG: hypothetical protein ACIAQU_13180 [Phycisphaerales bacterium JB064]